MNIVRPAPTRLVPTLTEVVEVAAEPAQAELSTLAMPSPEPPADQAFDAPALPTARELPAAAAATVPAADSPDELTDRVLARLQPRVEELLEDRLLEMLTPALLKLGEAWAAQARTELASTLRALVAEAVAEQLSKDSGPR